MDIKEVGSGPVISALCQELGIPETINNHLQWDEKQCRLDPGTLVLALIINILHGRSPLYRVQESFKDQDVELLFGPGVKSDNLNDDALGSVLDKIHAAGAKKVFCAVSFQVQTREKIDVDVLHFDTTARLVYGAYNQEGEINIVRGYNKERRTDLKQFKIGLGTNKDGYPLLGDVMNGNLDDKTWNKQVMKKLPEISKQLQQIIYVADSAMVTEKNLQIAGEKGLRFISRLPATFALSAKLIEKAFALDQWEDFGKLSPGKKRANYKAQEFREILYDREYRFIVVNSSHLDKRKLRGLENRVKKDRKKLEKEVQKLMDLSFACEPDAKEALLRFLKEKKGGFYPLSGTVESFQEKLKRKTRGRPPKDEKPQYRQLYRINLEIGELDEEALQREKERLSCFILISNVGQDYSTRAILKEYKEQTVVENRFKFIKHPLYVGPMFLQKKERLEALSYVILMALIVYIVLQRRARLCLKKEPEPLELTGGKKSFTPTGNKLLELFRPVKILYFKEGCTIKRYLPERYNYLARAVKLIGFDMDVFIRPRSP